MISSDFLGCVLYILAIYTPTITVNVQTLYLLPSINVQTLYLLPSINVQTMN